MCRLYGFRSNEPTKVECSLVYAQNALMTQSRADLAGESHPDGWGIGIYDDGRPACGPACRGPACRGPAIERRAEAAFEDLHFSAAAERVFSRTVLAHVRHATVGELTLANTHPFGHGVWLFAHNGTVTAFERVRPRLVVETDPELYAVRRGTTDSELYFFWLLSRMARAGIAVDEPCRDLDALAAVVALAVRELADLCDRARPPKPALLNLILTDGSVMVAVRWRRSLFWMVREGVHDCEICGIPHVRHRSGVDYRAAIVASEPITEEPWTEVPEGGLVTVDGSIRASVMPGA